MLQLLEDSQLVQKIGSKGRDKVLRKFEASKIADKYVNWYERILENL